MKKICLLIVLLFAGATLKAQQGLNLEIIANPVDAMGGDYQLPVDIANYNTSPWLAIKKSFTLRMNAGLALGYNFTDNMGISLGFLYSGGGQKYDDYTWFGNGGTVTWQKEITLNYIKLPLLFNYVSHPDQSTSFCFSGGFYVAFLTGYKDENIVFNSSGQSETITAQDATLTETSVDPGNSGGTTTGVFVGKPFNSSDFGGILAAGFQFKLSDKVSLPLMVNYQIGFSDVKNENSVVNINGDTGLYWDDGANLSQNKTLAFHNSALGLLFGLKINLAGK